ncbi:MAG TPA: hypothetical protein VLF62_01490 [Candidatus Saccharimonadales bacterium]|nr:hypothetical protein [Candidatus Saccharimonadales bacterium]
MNRIKTIVIYCKSLELGQDPFEYDYYWEAYRDQLRGLQQRGVDAYFAAEGSYVGNGTFAEAFTLEEKDGAPSDLVKAENIVADLVFDRGEFPARDVPMVNSPSMHKVGSSKIEIYKHFPQFQPFSVICANRDELHKAFEQITSAKVVVKEPAGFGGTEVYIGEPEEVDAQVSDAVFPVLAQTYIDTSGGIPGITPGKHDFRMIMCGGELIGCYLRIPKDGEDRANTSKGGRMEFLDVSRIPADAAKIAHQIDELFADALRYYSIDMGLTPDGWKLFEVDSLVGLHPIHMGEPVEYLRDQLSDYLVKVCLDVTADKTDAREFQQA